MRSFIVYILATRRNTALYVGITNDMSRRLGEHRSGIGGSLFVRKYNITKLVYFEAYDLVSDALKREKQFKSGSRRRKVEAIESLNPTWRDLAEDLVWTL